MTLINNVYEYLCSLAPLELQMSFDNSGFQIGRLNKQLHRVLLALDVTDPVVNEALELGAELIISHHPLIFSGIKTIDARDPAGERLLRLAENGIAVISMHTNLDIAEDGVNDVLIRLLGAEPVAALDKENCGRVGYFKEALTLSDFLEMSKKKLNANGLRYYDAGKPVSKLAVMGGAGGDNLEDAYALGCDTYLTSDIKYHQFLRAQELGINLIDADHFCTENPVIPAIREKLSEEFNDVEFLVSKVHKQIISFM